RGGQFCVDFTVGGDDAAVCRERIAFVGGSVRGGCGVGDGDAARVRVFDDGYGRPVEVEGRTDRGIGVGVVVVRHRLAPQQPGTGDAAGAVGVDRCGLMRVLPVAQIRDLLSRDSGEGRLVGLVAVAVLRTAEFGGEP